MIKLLRVDDRLIHGQVAMVWTSYLNANLIIVANDKVATDALQKMVLSLAKPPGVELKFLSIDDTVSYINSEESEKKQVFLVVDNTLDALRLSQGSQEVNRVVIGGLRKSGDKKLIDRQVFMDQQDLDNAKEMDSLGKEVFVQVIPSEKIFNLREVESIFNRK